MRATTTAGARPPVISLARSLAREEVGSAQQEGLHRQQLVDGSLNGE